MGCKTCGQKPNLSDPYMNKEVILINGIEGRVYTRLASDKTTYGVRTSDGSVVWAKATQIKEILK